MGTPILSIPVDAGIDWNKCKVNCLCNIRESWIPQQTSIKSASSLPKPQNLLERNNEKHLKPCWITAYLVAYCARDYHMNKYDEPYPENIFFPLFITVWGKWGYFNSFRTKMACLNNCFRNIFLFSITFTCSMAALLLMHVCKGN